MSLERDHWFRDEIFPLERELRGYLRKFFADQEAKDIVQQCYAQICAMSDFRSLQSPRAFIFTLARNLAIERVRHDRVVPMELVADLEGLDVLTNAPSAEQVAGAREELRLLCQAIETLPTQCQQVFTLRKVYGLSQKEISAKLGIAEHTVEKHVAKGVRLCTEYLVNSTLSGPNVSPKTLRPQSPQWLWKRKKVKSANDS